MHPHFIGIGAQKAGTSWIYACLEEHPEIFMPVKEIHFFSKIGIFQKGLDWYESHFDSPSLNLVTGEFSTTYLHTDGALERIYSIYPYVKVIVSIRDPISRAESHFNNDIRAGIVPKGSNFSDNLLTRSEYWRRGIYYNKLDFLFRKFGRDSVLVLILEDGMRDPKPFIQSIYSFLGVDRSFIAPSLRRRINVSAVPRYVSVGKFMDFSASVMRSFGWSRLIRSLRNKGVIEWARRVNSLDHDLSPGRLVWPKEVIEELDADRRQLKVLLGRDFSCWRNLHTIGGGDG